MEIIDIKTNTRKFKGDEVLDELIYNIRVDQIHLDETNSKSKKPGQGYSSITLCYDERKAKPAMRIIKEASKQGRAPEVYIQEDGDQSNFVVVFRVQPISARLIRGLMPRNDQVRYGKQITNQTSLILAAGGTSSRHQLRAFQKAYQNVKSFSLNVAILLDQGRKQLWGTRLTVLFQGAPAGWGR